VIEYSALRLPAVKLLSLMQVSLTSEKPSSCTGIKQKNREAVKARRNELGNTYWKNGHPKGNLGKKSPLKGENLY
jgi:hypothetical protein